MAQETSNAKAIIAADYDAVMEQLMSLRDELTQIAQSVSKDASSKGQAVAKAASDGMSQVASYVGRRTQAADARVEQAISANPYVAIGLAVGLGLVLGAMSRR